MRKYYTEEELDDLVEKWHAEENAAMSLYEFIGVSREEYFKWVSNSNYKLLKPNKGK